MFHIYVHLRDAKFIVLIDPNATFEQLKREIFIVHNRCFPGLDLPSVSVIKSLCDHNGYMIADHYQISSVIRDNSVIFAIVDHDSAVCSQETFRFHGIGNIPIQGSSPAQSAIVYNQNPPLQSSQQHVSQPSFLFPDTSLPDIMRCPVAVDCVSYISELQKPVGKSRKRQSKHSKSSGDTTAVKMQKKAKGSLRSCGTLMSIADSKCEDGHNENDLKSVLCADSAALLTNGVGCDPDVPPHISNSGACEGVKVQINTKAIAKNNAGSLSSKLSGSCMPSTNKHSAISANSFLPAEVSDFSTDSEDEHEPAASKSTKSSTSVKPNKTGADVRKVAKKVMDPALNDSSSETICSAQTTKGHQTQRNKNKNASGSSVKPVVTVPGGLPVRKVEPTKSFLPSTSDDSSDSDSVKKSHGKLTSQVILPSDKTASSTSTLITNILDDANIDNSSVGSHRVEHFTEELHDVSQQNVRDDGTNTDIIAQETQSISETQLDQVPSPEIPLLDYREKTLQDDEIRFENENAVSSSLPRARFLQNEKNEKQKTDQLSDKEACNTTCVNHSVLAPEGRSIAGCSNTIDTSDQKENNADATAAKKVHKKVKSKRSTNGKTSRSGGKSSHNIVTSMPPAPFLQQDVCAANSGSAEGDAQSTIIQDVVVSSEFPPSRVGDATKCCLSSEALDGAIGATVSTNFDDRRAVAREMKGRRGETKKDDPFDFIDDALLNGPLCIKVKRSGAGKKLNSSVAEDSSSDVEHNAGLAILVEDAKKCTPRNKKPTISTELPETTPNVKLSSAVFSLTPSTSTRKMGKHFTLQRNKATVTKAAPLPEQNFSVSQLSQEEIRFSQDASENLSKLFNNELWQRQS